MFARLRFANIAFDLQRRLDPQRRRYPIGAKLPDYRLTRLLSFPCHINLENVIDIKDLQLIDFAMMLYNTNVLNYQRIITIESGKRGGRPCVRGMRIAVSDVLGWLASGMTHAEIISDFPELTDDDIRACLAFAADRERRTITVA